ncbi:hypothetical protein AOZ06_04000 [Kibdelosporangium phytohabitans]|uniref:Uncharacterized protein n=1 Tax=Kibdelosporangium phytohabitans TaxID=860235 RepID=A0A0N7F2L9_9PSEU|nr:hypothetical protein AOZ06_04000 [Kibdelosporangium phytohabitans]
MLHGIVKRVRDILGQFVVLDPSKLYEFLIVFHMRIAGNDAARGVDHRAACRWVDALAQHPVGGDGQAGFLEGFTDGCFAGWFAGFDLAGWELP